MTGNIHIIFHFVFLFPCQCQSLLFYHVLQSFSAKKLCAQDIKILPESARPSTPLSLWHYELYELCPSRILPCENNKKNIFLIQICSPLEFNFDDLFKSCRVHTCEGTRYHVWVSLRDQVRKGHIKQVIDATRASVSPQCQDSENVPQIYLQNHACPTWISVLNGLRRHSGQ